MVPLGIFEFVDLGFGFEDFGEGLYWGIEGGCCRVLVSGVLCELKVYRLYILGKPDLAQPNQTKTLNTYL